MDLAHFGQFLPYFGGSGPGYGSFWGIFALFRGFGPSLMGVLGLDLVHFGVFLPYFMGSRPISGGGGGSGPGSGSFWAS